MLCCISHGDKHESIPAVHVRNKLKSNGERMSDVTKI